MQRDRVAVDVEQDGRVRRVTLPGGDLSAAAARELADVADELVEDRTVRVITLSARSGSDGFCTGPGPDLDPVAVDPVAAWARLRPPVVAAIDGRCRSVGLELVLAADIRLCTPAATFALPDLAEGRLPCWGGTQRLPRAIRPAEATAMVLLGSELDAARAAALGLVHDVVDDLGAATDAVVAGLVALGPLALELAKEAVHRGSELPLRDGLRLEGDLNHQLAATEDRAEGLAAFFDKRPPDFAGR